MKHIDTECRLQLGEFSCSLRFPGTQPEYCRSVRDYFEHFLTDQPTDLTIDVAIELHTEEITVPNTLCLSKKVQGDLFNYSDGLIAGQLDMQHRSCYMKVKRVLFGNPTVRIFEQFFHQLYHTLLHERYQEDMPVKLLLHSSGVLRNGCGYVFTGRSGSGKSTVAALSGDYDILNDEMCLIAREESGFTVQATPFNGFFRAKKNLKGPLKAIFFLKQAQQNFLKESRIAECVIPLAREIVTPMGILDVDKKFPLSKMIELAEKVLSGVAFYELHFLPDKSFWQCIHAPEAGNEP
ncbi:hypothetical protein ACFL43_00740 [Thermodesulfobacteriota bacterium]